MVSCCTVLYCTVLYGAVLYCTVLYYTVLYCTIWNTDPTFLVSADAGSDQWMALDWSADGNTGQGLSCGGVLPLATLRGLIGANKNNIIIDNAVCQKLPSRRPFYNFLNGQYCDFIGKYNQLLAAKHALGMHLSVE